ncbi:MAG: hypothetical protein IPI11_16090 [Haliscomenobacter sp.]|nr:hypothetical protein [Haliscomenobacter sp.]
MKHVLLQLLLLFLLIFTGNAQEPGCGTQGGEAFAQQLLKDLDHLRVYEAQFLEAPGIRTTTSASLPVQFHVVRTTGGSTSLTQGTLNQAMIILNNYFQYANIQFFQCAAPKYIDDTNLASYYISQQKELVAKSFVKNVINIYCVNTIEGGGVGGYTYLPGSGQPDLIVMDDGLLLNATLTHEMGHFFGLLHTHGSSNCPSQLPGTDELVDGSNCLTAGDYICDTPADPGLLGAGCLEYQVNPNCEYVGVSRDAKGAAFRPDVNNAMSYSRSTCRNRLSPWQYARINAIYQEYRTYLACSESGGITQSLSLSSPLFFSPNPVKGAKPFTVSAQVVNSGNAPFTGKLKAVVFNSLNEELSTLGIKTIKDTLSPGESFAGLLEFSNPNLLLPEGAYKLGLYYLADSAATYQLVGNEKYASYVSFTVEGVPLGCSPPDSVWIPETGLAHLIFEWTATTVPSAYYKVAYREKGKTSWTEIPNWSANRMVIVNRKPCTAYEFRVQLACPEGQSEWTPILEASTLGCQEAYCLSYGNSLRTFIQEVSIGNVRNISDNNYGYKDFTAFKAEVTPGGYLTMNLVPGKTASETTRTVYWRVWADLNRDHDFDDAGEVIFQGSEVNTKALSAAWQVPDALPSGETRIRISMDTKSYPSPCATNDYRDVEDYSLVVSGPLTLTLNPASLELAFDGKAAPVALNASQSWTAAPDQPWLQISQTSGLAGTHTLTVSALANPDVHPRTGTIVFKAGLITRTLKVSQTGKRTDVEKISFPAAGGVHRLLLNSGTGWKLLSKPSWIIQVNPTEGSPAGAAPIAVNLSCAPNPDEKGRSGLAVIQWNTGEKVEIEIVQDANQAPQGWGITATGGTHMILIPPDVEADFGGQPLLPGDYIGFFFTNGKTEQCAGMVRWQDKFAMVTAFGDDPGSPVKEGFTPGETFIVRVWQLSTQREWKTRATFSKLAPTSIHTHTDKFFPNGISQIAELVADTSALFTLTLKSGFDLVSLPVVPANPNFLALVDPAKADLEEIQDYKGAKLVPATSLNQIGNFDVRKGYSSKSKKTVQLGVAGSLVKPSANPIPVPLGWSIIPFWSLTARPLSEAIASIAPSVIMIKDQEDALISPPTASTPWVIFFRGKLTGSLLQRRTPCAIRMPSWTERFPQRLIFLPCPWNLPNFSGLGRNPNSGSNLPLCCSRKGLKNSSTLWMKSGYSTVKETWRAPECIRAKIWPSRQAKCRSENPLLSASGNGLPEPPLRLTRVMPVWARKPILPAG